MGLLLATAGVLLLFADRLPLKFGRLPGDILIKGKNGVFYLPFATCLLASLVLSLILWAIQRFGGGGSEP